jgi:hypothetical protein
VVTHLSPLHLVAVVALAAAACADDLPDKPEAPDMSALVAAYASPTATFDQPTADALIDRIGQRLALVDRLEALEGFLADALAPAIEEGAGGDDDEGGASARRVGRASFTIEGEGFLQIRHICRGFGATPPPVDAAENGLLTATVGFTEAGLDPVLWGTFEDCESVVADAEVLLDGGVNLYLGENLQIGGFGDAPILFELTARVTIDGEAVAEPRLDFQICPSSATSCPAGTLELLFETTGGQTLTFFVAPGRTTGGFRAVNGQWDCGFDEAGATCSQDGADPVVLVGLKP